MFALLLTLGFADPVVSEAATDADGFRVHTVRCEYQTGITDLRVLHPAKVPDGAKLPVVFVLPVEAKRETKYGDGLTEVKKLGLADKYHAVFVAPSFAQLPWYADHPTDPEVRQEAYLLKVIVPYVEKAYPVKADARYLLGFSKSGWGAWSLLLRNPDVFHKAAAFDAPMMMDAPGKYGSGPVFGTKENFEGYRVSALLEKRAKAIKPGQLILLGTGNFRGEHEQVHALMGKLGVPHIYPDTPVRKHDWHSGWVADAATELFR